MITTSSLPSRQWLYGLYPQPVIEEEPVALADEDEEVPQ